MGHGSVLVGLDLGPLQIGPTPLAMLIVAVVLAAVLLLVAVAGSQIAGGWVDKKWPANEPLTPSEVLWAESGGHVARTFPGLDPTIARDLTQYIQSKKVGPGSAIVEAGQLATHFVMLKSGTAQVSNQAGASDVKAGATFGADNIIRRTPYDVDVVTTSAAEVVTLSAEDYLAAVALGMSDDDDDYVVNVLGGYFASPTAPPASPAAPPAQSPGGWSPPTAPGS